MSTENTGRLFVGIQATLLIALIALPSSTHWPTPEPLRVLGLVIAIIAVGLVLVAATDLGAALTATPVPKPSGELRTDRLYGYVRHPIYSAVLLAVVGATIRSGNLVTLGVAIALVVFFNVKARWEETKLSERYGGYAVYAATTPRFIPRFWS